MEQHTVSGHVAEYLPHVLAVVQRLSVRRVNNREHDERVVIAGVASAAVVVWVLRRVERMAACQSAAAIVMLGVARCSS